MASMSRTASTSPPKGFSILQPALGAALSWMPAVGTPELEQLINAYLPGPASAQEKRAAISMDFFEHSAQTGENFKYYPVNAASFSPASFSPASSALNTSPAMSDLSYYSSPSQASTPSASAANTARRSSQNSAAKAERTDFSHLPGMKIMTAAGEDVTNSVSRGCKTKEQREHAHLMRVLKACDACKKKKIRCDPSHKRRPASQVKSAKAEAVRPAKKSRKSPSTPASQSASFTPAAEASLDLGIMGDLTTSLDQPWDEFMSFNDDPINVAIPQDFYNAVPQDFDFFLDADSQFSPANSGSSGFTDSPALPLTPVGSAVMPLADFTVFNDNSLCLQAGGQEPTLPYLSEGAHGSNYVDFNLYSPSSSFIDEEPQKLKAGDKRKASAILTGPLSQHTGASTTSSTGLLDGQQWRIDHSQSAGLLPNEPEWQLPRDEREQQGGFALELTEEDFFIKRPWHVNVGGYDSTHAVTTTARPHGLLSQQQAVSMISPTASAALRENLERHGPAEDHCPSSTAVTAASSPIFPRAVSAQVGVQQELTPFGGEAQRSLQTVSPTELQVSVSRLTPRLRDSALNVSSPMAAPSLAGLSRSASGSKGSLHSGLLPAGGLYRLQVLDGKSSPVSHQTVALLLQEGELRTSSSATSAGLFSPSKQGLSLGLERQLLHGKTANAASRSSLQRLSPKDATSPVRQLLGYSSSMAQLAVFGLVSILLIVVGFTSLLQSLQTPLHIITNVQQYLAVLPSIVILVILSCLSSLSDKSRLDAIHSVRSKVSDSARASLRQTLGSGSAWMSLACF